MGNGVVSAPAVTWLGMALGAAMLWGLQYSLWGQVLKVMNPLAALWWYCLVSFVVYSVFLGVRGVDLEVSVMKLWPMALMMVGIGLIGFAANVGMLTGMKLANPTLVTMITASSPLFTAAFAYLLFRSVQVNWMTVCGFALILAGVGVVAWSKQG